MAKAAVPKKPIFIPGAFDDLRAAASGDVGSNALRVRLVDIDEDPNQPRTTFDQAELQQLADTITMLGSVLQPIGLRAAVGGRYQLVFGARRFRASKLLNLADIPAIIVADDQAGLAAQVIENQARANLTNSDLAAVVSRLSDEGMKGKQIATVCGLSEHAVTMFRSASRLPPFLVHRMNDGDMRAIYELFTVWQKQPAEIEAACNGHEASLSITEARRLIEAATGRTTSSIYLRGKVPVLPTPGTSLEPSEAPLLFPEPPHSGEVVDGVQVPEPPHSGEIPSVRPPSLPPVADAAPVPLAQPTKSVGSPVFVMELPDGRRGVLMTNRRATTKGTAILDVQGEAIEALFVELRPVDVG